MESLFDKDMIYFVRKVMETKTTMTPIDIERFLYLSAANLHGFFQLPTHPIFLSYWEPEAASDIKLEPNSITDLAMIQILIKLIK